MEAAITKAIREAEAAQQPADEDFEGGSSGDEPGVDDDLGSSDSGEEAAGSSSDEEGGSDDEDDELDDIDADLEADDEGDGGSSSGGEEEEEDSGAAGRRQEKGFLEGGKADAFAKAFTKIMEKAGKKAEAAEADAPILAGSKSIAKRKAEVAEAAAHDKEAKRLRLEMKQRGHVVPTRRGQDPAVDTREKSLQRLATRGVVRLFNAIAKAQKQLREAEEATGNKAKAAKLGRASFLAELKGGSSAGAQAGATAGGSAGGGAAGDKLLVPQAPGQLRAAAAAVAAAGQAPKQQRRQQRQRAAAGGGSESEEEGEEGWEVLQKGFAGLQGGNKMKDWDKQVSEEEEGGPGELESEEEGDSEGW